MKKGISAIVATILIILITVAAITIIWGLIIPLIQQDDGFGTYDADIVIETEGGYTYFDSEKGVACVQIKKMSSDSNLTRIEVLFSYDGVTLEDRGNFSGDEIPEGNELKQKCFDLTGFPDGDGGYIAPDSIKVVPIYFDGVKEVVGDVVAVVTNYGSSGGGGGGGGGGSYPGNPGGLDLGGVRLMGDLNGDCVVNFTDYDILSGNSGMSSPTWADGDLNGDGFVRLFSDGIILRANLGLECED